MVFVVDGCDYHAFAVYEGEMYEISHYRSSGNPYTVRDLIPHARRKPDELAGWIQANINAYIRTGRCNWYLMSVDAVKIPIDDKLNFWVEKWT